MSTIKHLSGEVERSLKEGCPWLYKNPLGKLSLCVATILEVRSCNTMEISAALPLSLERSDMRYQWFIRFLSAGTVDNDKVMKPFARQTIELSSKNGEAIILCMDQTSVKDDHIILAVSIRFGNRCLPLFWRTQKGKGNIGFKKQKEILDIVSSLIPTGSKVLLMGDRFYGSVELIRYLHDKCWDYRLRLKSNITVDIGTRASTTGELAMNIPPKGIHYKNVLLTEKMVSTNIGIVHEKDHPEPWIIAMKSEPNYYKTMDYGLRWGIEPMFSDFKTRGFGLEDTKLECPEKIARLILILSLALHWAVLSGVIDAAENALPYEKKQKNLDTIFTKQTVIQKHCQRL